MTERLLCLLLFLDGGTSKEISSPGVGAPGMKAESQHHNSHKHSQVNQMHGLCQ